mmetsp:Transcript_40465/g.86869  ORF Transcript_40465/g.86869 Transcript_40465/m.86869 type:complete len:232 (+) Transcript_40465:1050-1745(+)
MLVDGGTRIFGAEATESSAFGVVKPECTGVPGGPVPNGVETPGTTTTRGAVAVPLPPPPADAATEFPFRCSEPNICTSLRAAHRCVAESVLRILSLTERRAWSKGRPTAGRGEERAPGALGAFGKPDIPLGLVLLPAPLPPLRSDFMLFEAPALASSLVPAISPRPSSSLKEGASCNGEGGGCCCFVLGEGRRRRCSGTAARLIIILTLPAERIPSMCTEGFCTPPTSTLE